MWQIKYQNEFLDLEANQAPELQRNSPLFFFDDIVAEVSTPVKIAYSDKNSRLLGYVFFELTVKTRKTFDVEIHDGGSFKANATLVIESAGMNRTFSDKSSVSGYLLVGVSNFLSAIKNKKLTELNLGGPITKSFTTLDPSDTTDGYWQMFQKTWDYTNNYVILPCRNENWKADQTAELSSDFMNNLLSNGNLNSLQDIVPFIKLQFVIENIFTEHGWTVDFSGLNDTEWEKLILFSAKPIVTKTVTWAWNETIAELVPTINPLPSVSFYLASFLPKEYTCSSFILQICKRYGWTLIFDINKRSCKFVALKEIQSKPVKDWTKFAEPGIDSLIDEKNKIFGFKNNFTGADQFPSSFTTEEWIIKPPVYKAADLPDPAGMLGTELIFAFLENQWYKTVFSEETSEIIWVVHGDNIYDETTDDADTVIETEVTTLPAYKTLYRTDAGINYYALFPYCEQTQYENWGIRTLLYHGMVQEVQEDGTGGTLTYPFASNSHLSLTGDSELTWSNVFKQEYNGSNVGIIEYWWRAWLNMIDNNESGLTQRFNLPLHELINYKWDDIILINNIPYLLKSIIEKPLQDGIVTIEAQMQRIKLKGDGEVVQKAVFIKLIQENVVTGQYEEIEYPYVGTVTYSNLTTANLKIKIFEDAAGTIPVNVTNLIVSIRSVIYKNATVYVTNAATTQSITGNEAYFNNQSNVFRIEYDYTNELMPAFNGHYFIDNQLLPGDGYIIIP